MEAELESSSLHSRLNLIDVELNDATDASVLFDVQFVLKGYDDTLKDTVSQGQGTSGLMAPTPKYPLLLFLFSSVWILVCPLPLGKRIGGKLKGVTIMLWTN